ncbi:GAF domain-containing sensor histidine kinase [Planomonospora venezuelensis]|uniref:histidine kinase n=1 Tax=Planomonospora venezuelensis TaxID=1999 RepID=A0A841DC85_PLAVE|nr:GAF domain-containing sensor histidine kinase [Planomonospora venezuelensis]MBB5966387.1 signal transduction histidine kinase [Planomonospora venezuelensis]GIN02788.1 sensor histidine kinase [Planomonospora venezuelensis]
MIPVPPDESERLQELAELHALDAPLEPDFQAIADLAAYTCRTPIALVTLVSGDGQHFRGRTGFDVPELDRRIGFCPYVVSGRKPLEIPDMLADPRFRDDPLVAGEPHVRYYAGAPLFGGRGHALGTVCVLDYRPRRLDPEQRRILRTLAGQAAALLQLHHHARQAGEVARRLHDVEELKQQFLRSVNHELRTPLTSIRSYLQLVQDGGLDEGTERRFLGVIERNSDRLLDLMDELLLMASLNANTAVFTPDRVNLSAVVREAVDVSAAKAGHKNQALRLHVPPDAPVWADAGRLRHALVHLLDNAVKFTPAEGAIDVTVTAGPGPGPGPGPAPGPMVEIHDTGVGIGAEDLEHVFEDFYRAPEAENQAVSGTGVGLAIVSKIIQLHGGSIHMDSTPHEGTCVRITLPAPPGP